MFYLAERVGLWRLLHDMLAPHPARRISSSDALKQYNEIITNLQDTTSTPSKEVDGKFFDSVIASLEVCVVPSSDDLENNEDVSIDSVPEKIGNFEPNFSKPRPLHFIASFERKNSLGLILSEVDTEDDEDDENLKSTRAAWKHATEGACQGEVFVRDIVKDGQADKLGIIEIGDRLVGVGEFPFSNNGFEGFLNMLNKVPERAKNIKIHFDRESKVLQNTEKCTSEINTVNVSSQGAWSSKGRRKANEDTVILQEINDGECSVLVAGVFDGHGGGAASKTALQVLPSFLSTQLKTGEVSQAIQSAWEMTCDTYKEGCSIYGECVADYDQREGILMAGTGSKDLVAGTTASIGALSINGENKDELIVLNCGDSRTLVVGEPRDKSSNSFIHFVTKDHSPKCQSEAERLKAGIKEGLDYSEPQCSVNRWWLRVGDYQYAVSRSLEGSFATSRGIVSDADISAVSLTELIRERSNTMMIIASDGLFERLDNELVGKEAVRMRKDGLSAKDTAKQLCSLALDKNTSDNVSAVVVFFD